MWGRKWYLSRSLLLSFLAVLFLSVPVGTFGEETYTIYASELRQLNATIETLKGELTDLQQSYRLLRASSGDLEELLGRYEERLSGFEKKTSALERTIDDLEKFNEQLHSHLATARQLLTGLRADLETLRTSFNEYKSAAQQEIRGAWFKGGALGVAAGVLGSILFSLAR